MSAATSRLIGRNVMGPSGNPTSMRLEPEIWEALFEICRREKIAMNDLFRKVDGARGNNRRTSAIRVFAFNYFREAAELSAPSLVEATWSLMPTPRQDESGG